MIELFIPVLFICINDNCNFMQGQTPYKSEVSCMIAINKQKMHMIELAGQEKITVIDGTCISIKIDKPGKTI